MTTCTTIHGKLIRAAIHSSIPKVTRVWLEDGSKHLVIGYNSKGVSQPEFTTVVGHWNIPDGLSYLSDKVEDIITRPFMMEYLK